MQAACGDKNGALETQKEFLQTVSGVVDGIPVVGHLKGGVHYAAGDKTGGDNAMKSMYANVEYVYFSCILYLCNCYYADLARLKHKTN